MPSPIVVKIDMPVYLIKFLSAQSVSPEQPLAFPPKSKYNTLLVNLISNHGNIDDLPRDKSFVKIYLPYNEVKDVYYYNRISEKNRRCFRQEVKADFLFSFQKYIRDKLLIGEQRKKAVSNFMDKYNLTEDDINSDSLYRKYSRYVQKTRVTY